MNREEIKDVLPHREPMLLVDEVLPNADGTVTGYYTVRGDEFFLQGHFPNNPIVPGVILCEMAAQCSCLIVAEEIKGKTVVYAGMNDVRFKKPVLVGDTVAFTCKPIKKIRNFYFMSAEGRVDGKTVLKGEFSFAAVDPAKIQKA